MVAVISVDAYPFFLAFSDQNCHLKEMGIGVFWLHCDCKEAELGSSDQEASPSAGKNTGLVLEWKWKWKCSGVEVRCYSYFW